jgi:hypothetical protein
MHSFEQGDNETNPIQLFWFAPFYQSHVFGGDSHTESIVREGQ